MTMWLKLLTTLLMLVTLQAGDLQSAQASEFDSPPLVVRKSVFLFNIFKFTQWPASSNDDKTELQLCIYSESETSPLHKTLDNRKINARRLRLHIIKAITQQTHCDAIFVGTATAEITTNFIDHYKNSNTLLISDQRGFARRGGHVEISIDFNSIYLVLNIRATKKSGFIFDSGLLKIAQIIR